MDWVLVRTNLMHKASDDAFLAKAIGHDRRAWQNSPRRALFASPIIAAKLRGSEAE